ncbi:MAG: ABC transporter ATP-binding protein [Peptostreptococcus sp.]|uniref:energy-coupling factor ABC transporter ATP-binding protein n=1 Tax=Peptostreptococcus sp. TaxID=1262 RepID=UPI002FC92895
MKEEAKEILRLENIKFSYDKKNIAIDDISLSLYSGEKVAIIGENGSGKSSLFLACNMINKISSGNIYLKNKKLSNKRSQINQVRKSVGIVFQNPNDQIIASNVYEEISFGPMNLGISIDEVRSRVEKSMEILSILDYRDRATQYLSGGEQKKVTIASILSMEPEIILFDEPMASLDMKSSRELEESLDMLSDKGIGIVASTHDIDFVWRWAQRIILMDKGKIIVDCKREEFFDKEEILSTYNINIPILYSVGKKLNLKSLPRCIEDLL